eukprot:m.40770 g.40770  ORF g.40770 m.40770 type:complete len:393 (-) comp14854_c0_seq1:352-1530(-)
MDKVLKTDHRGGEESKYGSKLFATVSDSMVDVLQQGRDPPILALSKEAVPVILQGFRTAKSYMEILRKDTDASGHHHDYKNVCIQDGEDSADASGYHVCGGLSRYNMFREGFVFSNNSMYDISDPPSISSTSSSTKKIPTSTFRMDMCALYDTMSKIASNVLSEIASSLGLCRDFFETEYGPIKEHSQWHLKRYHPYGPPKETQASRKLPSGHQRTVDGRVVLLPVHTDPSLISLVVISRSKDDDRCAVHFDGAMGLEYHDDTDPDTPWHNVLASGSGAVILFVGSVLHRISGGVFPATRHRVAMAETALDNIVLDERVVATFFFRPAPHSILRLLPSPTVRERHLRNTTLNSKNYRGNVKHDRDISFSDWKRKVSKKYEKGRRPASDHSKK